MLVALLVLEKHRYNASACLQGRFTDAAESFEAFDAEDALIHEGSFLLLAAGLIVGDELCVVSDGEVREEVFLEDSFVDGLKGIALAVLAQDGPFLINMALTSGSTAMVTPHRSILSPGEPIHFLVFTYSSLSLQMVMERRCYFIC